MVAKYVEVRHIVSADCPNISLFRTIFLFIISHFFSGGPDFFIGSKLGFVCSHAFVAGQKFLLQNLLISFCLKDI